MSCTNNFFIRQSWWLHSKRECCKIKSILEPWLKGLSFTNYKKEATLVLMNVKKERKFKKVNGKKEYVPSKEDIDEKSFKKS